VIAYCRVSTRDQNPQLQLDALAEHGYDLLFEEKISSRLRGDRPEFATAITEAWQGDTLVFWKSDRWGRSDGHVLTVVTELRERGVRVKSLTENFDLDTKEGRLVSCSRSWPRPPSTSWSYAPNAKPMASPPPGAAKSRARCCPARNTSAGPGRSARLSWLRSGAWSTKA
jgi:hypothetical protein